MIHTLDPSLDFFEHLNKDLGLEKINTGLPFGNSFISSNLNVNRLSIVNSCLRGCGLKFSKDKGYAYLKSSMRSVIENTDKELTGLNEFLRPKFIKEYQPTVVNLITPEQFLKTLSRRADPDFKNSFITDVIWGEIFLKNTTIMR